MFMDELFALITFEKKNKNTKNIHDFSKLSNMLQKNTNNFKHNNNS